MVILPDWKCGVRKFRHMVTREVNGTVFARKFVKYIGRPIRTDAQCREDSRQKRHVEYFEKKDPHAAP